MARCRYHEIYFECPTCKPLPLEQDVSGLLMRRGSVMDKPGCVRCGAALCPSEANRSPQVCGGCKPVTQAEIDGISDGTA